jgi:hypothetical protein
MSRVIRDNNFFHIHKPQKIELSPNILLKIAMGSEENEPQINTDACRLNAFFQTGSTGFTGFVTQIVSCRSCQMAGI